MSLPWNKINDFLLNCGNFRDPKGFSKAVLDQIQILIPFDQGRLYFINDNGLVYDEYLLGVDKQVTQEYHEYYSKVDNGAFSIRKLASEFSKHYPKVEECLKDQSSYSCGRTFFSEYVQPHQIQYSFGLGLRDTKNTLKSLFSLDRVCNVKYSEEEIKIMKCIRTHLDNLFQNFYATVSDNGDNVNSCIFSNGVLTRRESEIAALLVKGVKPTSISRKLYISITTVNKHIANMHAKLNVSTRQELIVKLLGN